MVKYGPAVDTLTATQSKIRYKRIVVEPFPRSQQKKVQRSRTQDLSRRMCPGDLVLSMDGTSSTEALHRLNGNVLPLRTQYLSAYTCTRPRGKITWNRSTGERKGRRKRLSLTFASVSPSCGGSCPTKRPGTISNVGRIDRGFCNPPPSHSHSISLEFHPRRQNSRKIPSSQSQKTPNRSGVDVLERPTDLLVGR